MIFNGPAGPAGPANPAGPAGTADEPLTGGRMTSGIVRRGGEVRRPLGPWSAAVHEYLRHLEAAGFTGAPRVLRAEGDTEVLSYLDGDVATDPGWQPGHGHRLPPYARTDRALAAAAKLIRALHDASAGFTPVHTGYRFHPHPPRPGEIVSHGDLGPWNTVYREGVPVAFIDWDAAQPTDPVTELAAAAWAFVPLAPAGRLAEAGFDPPPSLPPDPPPSLPPDPPPSLPGRLRLFLDGYGLADRRAILPALQRCVLDTAARAGRAPVDAAGAAVALEFHAAELRWLHGILPALARAL